MWCNTFCFFRRPRSGSTGCFLSNTGRTKPRLSVRLKMTTSLSSSGLPAAFTSGFFSAFIRRAASSWFFSSRARFWTDTSTKKMYLPYKIGLNFLNIVYSNSWFKFINDSSENSFYSLLYSNNHIKFASCCNLTQNLITFNLIRKPVKIL
jgi:hypothetical protein